MPVGKILHKPQTKVKKCTCINIKEVKMRESGGNSNIISIDWSITSSLYEKEKLQFNQEVKTGNESRNN